MTCTVTRKPLQQLKATNILPQTAFWGRVKYQQGYEPVSFEIKISKDLIDARGTSEAILHEDLLVLIKYITPTQCYAYLPYGPKIEPDFEKQGLFLETLSEALIPNLPDNCIFLRYDLMWANQWAYEEEFYDANGNWGGPPVPTTQEFRLNFNTEHWNLKKSSTDFLPKNTFFLDLSKDEEELLQNMRYNTRYNIRQASKKGVTVATYGIDRMDDWYALYNETAARSGMQEVTDSFFEDFYKLGKQEANDIHVSLLVADYNEEPLASMFLVLSKKRGTYLYGASTNAKKEMRASYALQWEAIKKAKAFGCEEYDMFGCAPNLDKKHPLHGVHLFKKGFGGALYHRMGCWDYPLQKASYETVKSMEMSAV